MFRRLLPREMSFFDYFERVGSLITQTCEAFAELAARGDDLASRTARIKELEHQGDQETYQCIKALHSTFITPIDRADIHHLIKHLDDVIDSVDGAAARISMYEIHEIRPEAGEMAKVLVAAAYKIEEALRYLRDMSDHNKITECCIAIHQLEKECDSLLRSALGRLFKEEQQNAFYVIKWKEIFEYLERATDQCEDVANIIEGVVIEAS